MGSQLHRKPMTQARSLGALVVAALVACGDADTTPDTTSQDTVADASPDTSGTDAADTSEPTDAAADSAVATDAVDAGADADAGPEPPRWLPVLTSLDDYEALRVPPGDVKYLAWVEDAERVAPLLEDCAFQDMARYPYHIDFLHAFEPWADLTVPGYYALVLRAETRVWWGGGVRFDPLRVHPVTGEAGIMLWVVYGDDGGLTVADVVAADQALAPCMPFVGAQRAFWASSFAHRRFVQQHRAALEAAGVAVVVGD